ncbi:YcaO-like family protein [Streptomyces sp. NPDC000941]
MPNAGLKAAADAGQSGGVGPWVEREVTACEAEERVRAALAELGLRPELVEVGTLDGWSTWRCRLLDAAGYVVPHGQGSGKGRRDDARIGALFEALEHHLTGPAHFDAQQVEFRAGAELVEGPFAGEACAPVLARLERVACHGYAPLGGEADAASGGGESIAVPAALTTSWYLDRAECRKAAGDGADYRQLARYGSNSGSAIGVTKAEALVHALNEAIERDALSLLLARAFLGPHARSFRPRVVDPATLPADLAAAHHAAEHLTGTPVHLLHTTTDIGVPAFVAYAPVGNSEMRSSGGASLSAHYAARRALTECIQARLLARAAVDLPPTPLKALARYPALHACARFDLTDHLTRADRIAFPADHEPPGTVEQQERHLTDLLTAAGHPPYHRTAASLPGGITAVHAFVPGLERFMTVLSGMLLLPGPRARAAARPGERDGRR